MMKTAFSKATRASMTTTVTALVSAGLLVALAGTALAEPEEAAFRSENGKIAFASNRTTGEGVDNPEGDFEIFTMEPDGTGLAQLTKNAAFDFDPDWSPDGEKIAFESNRDLLSDIFVINADGTQQTNVTDDPAFDSSFAFSRSPSFSPDGEKIAFDSNLSAGEGVDNPTRDVEIFVANLDGSGPIQLTQNTSREFHPDFSPNGRKIAFVSDSGSVPGIYTMNALDGTKQKKRSQDPGTAFGFPSWSPDGERISFGSNQDGGDEVYVMRVDGSGQKRLTNNGVARDATPAFSPDGRQIAFETNRDGNFEIYAMNRDGTEQTNLTENSAGDFTPAWQSLEKKRR